jgi:hypothetical protein
MSHNQSPMNHDYNQSQGPRLDMMLVLKNYSKVQTQKKLEVGHDHDD